jgi:uncharacterized protein (TIGR00255 family)
MIRSMTGFGVASADAEGGSFSVEVRSVNNKFFKATMRVPDALGALEGDLEAQLGKRISRGSVMVTVRVAESAADRVGRIDGAALEAYMAQLRSVLPYLVTSQEYILKPADGQIEAKKRGAIAPLFLNLPRKIID